MDPWSWRSGWESGSDEEEIRKRVAAARQHLLSEYFEAIEGMVILPGLGDPQGAEVLEEIMAPTSCHGLLPWTLHDRLYIFCYPPRTSEAEEIFFAIQKLRNENWVYRQWGVRISAQYHLTEKLKAVLDRADKFLSAGKTTLHGQAQVTEGRNTPLVSHKQEDTLDQLDAFSDPILTNKQAKAMESVKLLNCFVSPYEDRVRIVLSNKGVHYEDWPAAAVVDELLSSNPVHDMVSVLIGNKPVNLCESLDTLELVDETFREQLLPADAYVCANARLLAAYVDAKMPECAGKIWKGVPVVDDKNTLPNGSYGMHVQNYWSVHRPVVLSGGCRMWEGSSRFGIMPNIWSFYASGCISEKPKTQSTNTTGSACKDVHGLTDAEPENHRMVLQQFKDFTALSRACSLLISVYLDLLFIFTIKMMRDATDAFSYSSLYKDQTSSVQRGASSFVQFSVETSPEGGVDIKMGSYKIHVPKYGSVHRPLVQMVLFAQTLYGGTLACLKSMLPKSIVNLYESGRISEKPKTWSTSTGSACKNADDLTDAEPENHGAPNSSDHGIIAAEDKTAATWLIDTGAVHHATGKLDLISAIGHISDDLLMTARDGVRMRVHAWGTVRTETVVLPDVWYIPGLTKNIVSASQLNQLGYSIGFTRGTCFIRSATDGTLIGKGHVSEDGLFEMDFLKVS